MWAFATSAHGLALAPDHFWNLTPREYEALKAVWWGEQKQAIYRHADLQATLHNAWFKRKDNPDQFWSLEDFLPEALRPPAKVKTWQDQLAAFQGFTESLRPKTG